MKPEFMALAARLVEERSLSLREYQCLIDGRTPEIANYLAEQAVLVRKKIYGNAVYVLNDSTQIGGILDRSLSELPRNRANGNRSQKPLNRW